MILPICTTNTILFYLSSKIKPSTIPIVAIFLIMVWFRCASCLCHIDNIYMFSFFVSTPNNLATFACTTSRSSWLLSENFYLQLINASCLWSPQSWSHFLLGSIGSHLSCAKWKCSFALFCSMKIGFCKNLAHATHLSAHSFHSCHPSWFVPKCLQALLLLSWLHWCFQLVDLLFY